MDMNTEQLVIWGTAIYLVLITAFAFIQFWRINRWPYVVGKLLKADVEYTARWSAWVHVTYEYEVDGEKYVGNRLSPLIVHGQVGPIIKKQLAKIQYISNDQVKVFYNGKKPVKSYLVKGTGLNFFG